MPEVLPELAPRVKRPRHYYGWRWTPCLLCQQPSSVFNLTEIGDHWFDYFLCLDCLQMKPFADRDALIEFVLTSNFQSRWLSRLPREILEPIQ
jgi:hypothetical protein